MTAKDIRGLSRLLNALALSSCLSSVYEPRIDWVRPPILPYLFFKCLVGSIYHYQTRLENQEVRVEILESGGKVQ